MAAAGFILLIGAPGFSQIRTSVAPPPSSAAGKTGPGAPRKSDAEIEKAIRAKLAKSKIDADHFSVRVQGGVATISGATNVIQHKGVATRLAKGAGATRVANNIQIRQTGRGEANASLAQGLKRAEIHHGNAGPASPSASQSAFGSRASGAPKSAQIKQSDTRSVPASTNQQAVGSTAGSGLKRVQIVKRGDARSDSSLASQPPVASSAPSAQSR